MNKVLLGLSIIVLMAACADNEDGSSNDSQAKVVEIEKKTTDGQWRLIFFSQDGKEQTSQFNGYLFDFDEGNLITVTNGSENFPGNWAVSTTNRNDHTPDHQFGDIGFNISFNTPADFESLTENWEVVSLTDTKLELRHISNGESGMDVLAFERI